MKQIEPGLWIGEILRRHSWRRLVLLFSREWRAAPLEGGRWTFVPNCVTTNSKETQRKSLFPSWQRKRKKRMTWKLISDRQTFHALILPVWNKCLLITPDWIFSVDHLGFPDLLHFLGGWGGGGGHLVPLQKPHRKVRQNGDKAFLFCLSRN